MRTYVYAVHGSHPPDMPIIQYWNIKCTVIYIFTVGNLYRPLYTYIYYIYLFIISYDYHCTGSHYKNDQIIINRINYILLMIGRILIRFILKAPNLMFIVSYCAERRSVVMKREIIVIISKGRWIIVTAIRKRASVSSYFWSVPTPKTRKLVQVWFDKWLIFLNVRLEIYGQRFRFITFRPRRHSWITAHGLD